MDKAVKGIIVNPIIITEKEVVKFNSSAIFALKIAIKIQINIAQGNDIRKVKNKNELTFEIFDVVFTLETWLVITV